jgi:hypothetical protein
VTLGVDGAAGWPLMDAVVCSSPTVQARSPLAPAATSSKSSAVNCDANCLKNRRTSSTPLLPIAAPNRSPGRGWTRSPGVAPGRRRGVPGPRGPAGRGSRRGSRPAHSWSLPGDRGASGTAAGAGRGSVGSIPAEPSDARRSPIRDRYGALVSDRHHLPQEVAGNAIPRGSAGVSHRSSQEPHSTRCSRHITAGSDENVGSSPTEWLCPSLDPRLSKKRSTAMPPRGQVWEVRAVRSLSCSFQQGPDDRCANLWSLSL